MQTRGGVIHRRRKSLALCLARYSIGLNSILSANSFNKNETMRTLSEINVNSTEEEITKFSQEVPMMSLSSEIRQMYMNYATSLLVVKQQQKLINDQQLYNEKQLFWSRILAIGTWALVVATLLIVKFG